MRAHTMIIILAILLAAISSLGTLSYGYHFADFIKPYSVGLFHVSSILFAFCATFSNMALGTYSFLALDFKFKPTTLLFILLLSLLSAIPTGILSYFAYQSVFPSVVNLITMIAVILTNTGINSTALTNLIKQIKSFIRHQEPAMKTVARAIGLIIGILVSLSFYMATIHGLSTLLQSYSFSAETAFNLASLIGFVIWLPGAALFGNSTQICIAKFYDWLANFQKSTKKISKEKIGIMLIAIFSASAYAQIAIVFFDPKMIVPEFVKLPSVQFFIYHYLILMAFISAFSVNYYALTSLLKIYQDRNKHS